MLDILSGRRYARRVNLAEPETEGVCHGQGGGGSDGGFVISGSTGSGACSGVIPPTHTPLLAHTTGPKKKL
jgi:hypothetical protein